MPSPQPARETAVDLRDVAVVAIGRNEGERLRRCLEALPSGLRGVVYVDSASTDGSVELARRRGADVVALDLSVPFTAARARNAGLERLRARWPDAAWVQLVDGDCMLTPGWLEAGIRELARDARVAMVCGRRREARPEASPYNRLCDLEWDTPVGDVESCGGDVLARVDALAEVGGYDGRLVAGEEPELCARLRARGWVIRRIDRDMTFHDAAMTRFGQWWRRAIRSGHGFAQVNALAPALYRRELRSSVAWGLLAPAAIAFAAALDARVAIALLAAYPALWVRVLFRRGARGDSARDAALYATFCVVGKFAEVAGVAKYAWNRVRGRASRLIEYK